MTLLTNEEKLSIANQHKKSLEYAKYNVEISLIEENAVTSPSEEITAALNGQLAELNKKIAAIDAEIASITE